jgi:hypothetical protein
MFMLQDFEDIFGCFAEATDLLSGKTYATASLIIPVFESIKECVSPRPLDTRNGQLLRSSLKKSFDFYVDKYKYLSTPEYAAITFLDPRFVYR